MSTEAKRAKRAGAREAAGSGAKESRKNADRQTDGGPRWYIRQQGRNFQLLSSNGRPSADHADGARLVRVYGPYPSEEAARSVCDRYTVKGNAVEKLDLMEGADVK